jgi:hypothetical protein
MSLRDFNSTDDRIISLQHEPLGNGGGLDSFHTVQPEDLAPSKTPKIVGAVAVALMIGVAGVALYANSGSSMKPKQVVTASNLPAPAPAPVAAPVQQAAITPDANMPASAPAALDVSPAPVAPVKAASKARSHATAAASNDTSAASARMAADTSQSSIQPQQQQAVAVPAPVSPTPSPSDVATNNTQSGVPQGATTASDVPAPAVQPAPATPVAQPAPDQQAAATPAPAPAQAAGQVNQ